MTVTSSDVARVKGVTSRVSQCSHKPLRPIKGPIKLGRRGPLESAVSAASLRARQLDAMRESAAAKGFRTTPEGLRILVSRATGDTPFVLYVNKSGVAGIYALRDENEDLYKTLDLQQHVLFRFSESRDYGPDYAKDETELDNLYFRLVLYWSDDNSRRAALGLSAEMPLCSETLIVE